MAAGADDQLPDGIKAFAYGLLGNALVHKAFCAKKNISKQFCIYVYIYTHIYIQIHTYRKHKYNYKCYIDKQTFTFIYLHLQQTHDHCINIHTIK